MIGLNIKNIRTEQGLTQKQLAQQVGVAPVTIQQYERGVRTPKHEMIKRIAAALNVSATKIYGLPQRENEEQQSNLEHFLDESVDEHGDVDPVKFADARYSDLWELGKMTDQLYLDTLKNWEDVDLLRVVVGSFEELNRTGKIEALKRISELEINPRYSNIKISFDHPAGDTAQDAPDAEPNTDPTQK